MAATPISTHLVEMESDSYECQWIP